MVKQIVNSTRSLNSPSANTTVSALFIRNDRHMAYAEALQTKCSMDAQPKSSWISRGQHDACAVCFDIRHHSRHFSASDGRCSTLLRN